MGIDAEFLVKVKGKPTAEQVRRWSFLACATFGHEKFFLDHVGKYDGVPQHVFKVIDKYEQDGPTIRPKPGETFLTPHLWSRYYGPGYERGDAPFIILFGRWIEETIPNCEVWYGGDSSGVCATRFDAKAREALWKHFVKHAHLPYHDNTDAESPVCPLCVEPIPRYGWGQTYASYHCPCGWNVIYRDGETWQGTREAIKEAGYPQEIF